VRADQKRKLEDYFCRNPILSTVRLAVMVQKVNEGTTAEFHVTDHYIITWWRAITSRMLGHGS
jgi:hypothetical protein